jgi:hypothetical protein
MEKRYNLNAKKTFNKAMEETLENLEKVVVISRE